MELDEDDQLYDTSGIEMVIEGTQERNEQEEFQLQTGKERFDRGMDYWTDGNLECAMREFSASLEIREDICGRKDSETAKSYLWKGTIRFLQEEFEMALDDFYRCYRIQYEINGNQDGCRMSMNWINKCLASLSLKKTKDAVWKKFLACIEQEKNGDDFQKQGKFDNAIERYQSALQLEYLRRSLNSHSPSRPLADAGDLSYKIARCFQLKKNWDRAFHEYRQTYSIYVAKFGPDHRHTVITMDRLMEVLSETGFKESVLESYIESIPEAMRHEQAGDWKMNTKKDLEGALEDYKAAMKIEGQYAGKAQVACAILNYKMAIIYAQQKSTSQALALACRSVGVLEEILGSQNKHTSVAQKLVKTLCRQPTTTTAPTTRSSS